MLRDERAVQARGSAREPPTVMYVRHGQPLLLALLTALLLAGPARAQLIEGLDSFTDATVGLASTKWTGPRVPAPVPAERPPCTQQLDSRWWPVSVHADASVPATRVASALAAAETSFAALFAAGFVTSFGDGSGPRDLYLVGSQAAGAGADASGNFSALDGTRAFARVDPRVPADRLLGCVAQALMEAQLLELDPAEAAPLRRGVAAYYGELVGGSCEDEPRASPHQSPFDTVPSAAAWFERLSARQDRNRGTFLFDMWQFARQRTWEGRDLRASPDLFEAIAKALSLSHEDFDLLAGELSEAVTRVSGPAPRSLAFTALPTFPDKRAPPLEVLGSVQLRVELGVPRPGTRLRAWSRAEAGGRYTLSALRLDALGVPLSRLELAPRRDPNAQLSIELDARTFAVAVALTRVADEGLPDPDAPAEDLRSAGLIVDTAP
jgi:hypothetical protein